MEQQGGCGTWQVGMCGTSHVCWLATEWMFAMYHRRSVRFSSPLGQQRDWMSRISRLHNRLEEKRFVTVATMARLTPNSPSTGVQEPYPLREACLSIMADAP